MPASPNRNRPPRKRHPLLFYALIAALALGAAASLLWTEEITQAVDSLGVKEPSSLLPP